MLHHPSHSSSMTEGMPLSLSHGSTSFPSATSVLTTAVIPTIKKMHSTFKCFSDASQFSLDKFYIIPTTQLPYCFELEKNYMINRCVCQAGEVILKEKEVVTVSMSLKVNAPVEYAWMISKDNKKLVNSSDAQIHAIPLGSFQPREEPYEIIFKYKYPLISQEGADKRTNKKSEGVSARPTHVTIEEQSQPQPQPQHHLTHQHSASQFHHQSAFDNGNLPPESPTTKFPPPTSPNVSQNSYTNTNTNTNGNANAKPSISGVAGLVGMSLPLLGTAGISGKSDISRSNSLNSPSQSPSTTKKFRLFDNENHHDMNVSTALYNMIFDQATFEEEAFDTSNVSALNASNASNATISNNSSNTNNSNPANSSRNNSIDNSNNNNLNFTSNTSHNSNSSSSSNGHNGTTRKSILTAMKSGIAKKLHNLHHHHSDPTSDRFSERASMSSYPDQDAYSSQVSPPSPSPSPHAFSNSNFSYERRESSTSSFDSESVRDDDEESIPELESNEQGELVNIYRSSPLVISKKMFKQYRQYGQIGLSQKFYIIEKGGRILAKINFSFVVTNLELPRMCQYCKNRFDELYAKVEHANKNVLCKKTFCQLSESPFRSSSEWKIYIHKKLLFIQSTQVEPYKSLVELQDRLFNKGTEVPIPEAGDMDKPLSTNFSDTELPQNIKVGKFVNQADLEEMLNKLKTTDDHNSSMKFFESRDGLKLSYRFFPAKGESRANIIMLGHFGFGSEWCRDLAGKLRTTSRCNVYLLYMRGHGESEGDRGDAPSKESLWRDVRSMVRFVKWNDPYVPLFMGGHSGGAGFCLNYNKWSKCEPPHAYFFITPFLAELMRKHKRNMTKKDRFQLALNNLSGGMLAGHWTAINIKNFANKTAAESHIPDKITVNVLSAVLVTDAKEVFTSLSKPFGLWVGANDEIFPPEDIVNMAKASPSPNKTVEIIADQTHLGILNTVDEQISEWIKTILPGIKKLLELEKQKHEAEAAAALAAAVAAEQAGTKTGPADGMSSLVDENDD